ncbi:MAG: hypothetical protein ABIH66_11995 [bacterium]
MKTEEPEPMREIREIRRRHYEETKNMTIEERMAYIREKSEELEKETGIKLPRLSKISK